MSFSTLSITSFYFALCILLVWQIQPAYSIEYTCKIQPQPGFNISEVVLSPLPSQYIKTSSLPKYFDWRYANVNGSIVNLVTRDWNHHIPVYCGACWTMGSMSTFVDRIKIMRKADWPDYDVARQYLLNCGTFVAGTCLGGYHLGAFQLLYQTGIPIDTCLAWQGVDNTCDEVNTCQTCSPEKGCRAITNFPLFKASEYGMVIGEDDMMKEIYARGPIAAIMDSGPIESYKAGCIWQDQCGKTFPPNHIVEIVGWGEEENIKYWIVRNSWGQYWGEQGWFKIIRGKNCLGIEEVGAWVIPEDSWSLKSEKP